jgi:putative FmdB family regulatory protein
MPLLPFAVILEPWTLCHNETRKFLLPRKPSDCFPPISGLGLQEQVRIEEGPMPHYEYLCTQCNKKFSVVLTIEEHEKGKVKCPKCGGTKVEQQWAAFYATTSKKS